MNIISLKKPKSPIAESYRNIRTNIEFANIDEDIKVIMVTSSKQNEGKSTVIANLATTFGALEDKKILIMDGDLRNPTVHRKFNVSNLYGVTDILLGNRYFDECICSIASSNIDILPAGKIAPNPSEILGSTRMESFIDSIKDKYDYIFIDAPPVGIVTDAAVMSRFVDGTILVAASKEVDVEMVKIAKQKLEKVDARILGVVLNKFEEKSSVYGYYGYYNEEEQNVTEKKKRKKPLFGFSFSK